MRGYAIFSPRFWTGTTGRQMRSAGRDAQLLAAYLITAPGSNMIGLYELPFPTLCAHVNMTPDQARTALATLADLGFVRYDFEAELAWVIEGARYQMGATISPKDKRYTGGMRLLSQFKGHPFAVGWYRRYRAAYSLPRMVLGGGSQGPRKQPRSQEQEQEQEQNDTPPSPPADAGGDASAHPEGTNGRDNGEGGVYGAAVQYLLARGDRAWRPVRRLLAEWVKAGCGFEEIKARIDAGEHQRRSPL